MVRLKNRYITAQIEFPLTSHKKPVEFSDYDIYKAVSSSVAMLHGEFGAASIQAGLKTKYCNRKTKLVIIRVRHGPHLLVTSSLPFITKIGKQECSFRILYVGATLVHCYRAIQNYQRNCLVELLPQLANDSEMKELEESIMKIDCDMSGKKKDIEETGLDDEILE